MKARQGGLKENEKAILRTERVMGGQKIVDRKTTQEQMDMLGLKKTIGHVGVEETIGHAGVEENHRLVSNSKWS